MVLVCYDGSADADAAIDEVARLMPGTQVAVLTVWFLRRGGQRLLWVIVAVGLLAAGLGYAFLQNS